MTAATKLSEETIKRLAKHVLAKKLVPGQPGYENRNNDRDWADENLPQTREDFDRVMVAADRSPGAMTPRLETAATLLRTAIMMSETRGRHVLCSHSRLDLSEEWGVESSSGPVHRKTGTETTCCLCNEPATHRAARGPACANHYDDLSN